VHENIFSWRPFRKEVTEVADINEKVGISVYDLSGRLLQEVFELYKNTIPEAKISEPNDGFDMEVVRVKGEIVNGRDYVREFGSALSKKSKLVIRGTNQVDKNHKVIAIKFESDFKHLGGAGLETKFDRDIAHLLRKEKLAIPLI